MLRPDFGCGRGLKTVLLCCAAGLLACAGPAAAQQAAPAPVSFDIPAQDAGAALRAYARQANRQVLVDAAAVRGRTTPAVRGRLTRGQALAQLARGASLVVTSDDGRTLTLAAAPPPFPPEPAGAASPRGALTPIEPASPQLSEVLVTGTRIQGASPVAANLTTLTRRDIQDSGRTTAADLVRLLPEVTNLGSGEEIHQGFQSGPSNLSLASGVNLRGLGVDATLTLLNGHRLASSNDGGLVDVSQIPLLGVERVEVLADGASALYGSDAVAGVVNFILRKDVDGGESLARYGDGDGFHQATLGQSLGRTWRGGGVFLAAQYDRQTALAAGRRSYFTDDLRPFGGPDLRQANGVPGTLVAGGVSYALPPGQDGRSLTPAQLAPGTANLRNRWSEADITPSTERYGGVLTLHQDLAPRLAVFLDAIVSRRRTERRDIEATGTLVVPRSNPFFVSPVPGASSVTVLYNYGGGWGATSPRVVAHDATVHGGLAWQAPHGWDVTASGVSSRSWYNYFYDTLPNSTLVTQALADPDPATALNPFGDAGANSAAVLDRIRGYIAQRHRLSLNSVNLDAGGRLFGLPAGEVRLALGGEVREERLHSYSPRFLSGGAPTVASAARLSRQIAAVYAELRVPLASAKAPLPLAERLTISAAVRGERYSDVGATWNPKLGLDWGPTRDLTLSLAWGSAFKAPALPQTQTNANTISVSPITLGGAPVNAIFLGGVSPGLKPETAETWTAGLHYAPRWLEGVEARATWFRVDYRNRILRPSAVEFSSALATGLPSPLVIARNPDPAAVQAYYAEPLFSAVSSKPPPASIAAVLDNRAANLGAVTESGVDFDLRYGGDLAGGALSLVGDVTYLGTYRITRISGTAAVDALNTTNNPVDLRARLSASWRRGGWQVGAAANYTGDYRNTTVTPAQHVRSWTTLDGHLGYALPGEGGRLAGVSISLDLRNLLDATPPRVANVAGQVGYDPEEANALGRVVSLTLTKAW